MLCDVLLLQSLHDGATDAQSDELLQLLRSLETAPAADTQALADKALALAQERADPPLQARTRIVLARAALGRCEWVDAFMHSQMALGIAMHLGHHALLQSALTHAATALLQLDEPEMAVDLFDDCADMLRPGEPSSGAQGVAVDAAQAQVWVAQARAKDATTEATARQDALSRARIAALRAAEAACQDGRQALRVHAFETLVDVLLEAGDAATVRQWQQRLGEAGHEPTRDDDLANAVFDLSVARLDLHDGAEAAAVLSRLLRLHELLPPSPQHLTHTITLMLCLSQAHERCGDFEQALRCRKRWAEARDRVAATLTQQQSKWTQRTLDNLRSQANEFITRALPEPLLAALASLRRARGEITDDAVRAKFTRAEQSTQRALALADQYLNVLSAEYSGQQSLRRVDLSAIAVEVCEHADPQRADSVVLRREIEPGVCVMGDASLLGRALANLLSNALRHAPAGSEAEVRVTRRDGLAVMSVSDRGPGLPLSMRTRLFQRYATDRADGGNGLGLALVARVARQHQARVQVQTEQGLGTTISFEMKLASGAADARSA